MFNTTRKICFSSRPENAKCCDFQKIKMFLLSAGHGMPSVCPFNMIAAAVSLLKRIMEFGYEIHVKFSILLETYQYPPFGINS